MTSPEPIWKRGWRFLLSVKTGPGPFEPLVSSGIDIYPGMIIGQVQETERIVHKILVPPEVEGEVLKEISPEGLYTVEDVIGVVETGAGDGHSSDHAAVLAHSRAPSC